MRDAKNIVITGGSLGIGFAVAKKCAEKGDQVVIAARNRNDLSNALKKLKELSDQNHQSYSLDVRDVDEIRRFVEWCDTHVGAISGLVNCAGIYGPIGKTTQVDLKKFREATEINLLGTVYMCSLFAPLIKAKNRKKIVNYSGGGGASAFPNYSAYAASKSAIVRFTENLSIELSEEHFDINCVAPGFVVTRLHQQTLEAGSESAGPSFYEGTKKQIATGGVPPEKAADLTAFLLSPESDGITGKFISAQWDPWQTPEFQDLLRNDKDIATLRRIDNKTFFKKS